MLVRRTGALGPSAKKAEGGEKDEPKKTPHKPRFPRGPKAEPP